MDIIPCKILKIASTFDFCVQNPNLLAVRTSISSAQYKSLELKLSKLKSCVKQNGLDFFNCSTGLMQGESLSPLLYSLYVNDIELELINNGCIPYELRIINLYLLMYADDMVLFSESIAELQKMIDTVNICSNRHDLFVNLSKTKIVVFRKRGGIKAEDKWFLNSNKFETCDNFMFLGILFYFDGNFVNTQKKLSEGKQFLIYLVKFKMIVIMMRQCYLYLTRTLHVY